MSPDEERIAIRRHRLPHVETYEVTAEELDQMENEAMRIGHDFSFASVSLAFGTSFLITLLTATVESLKAYNFFVVATIVGFVFSLYFGIRWYRGRHVGRSVIQRIRDREVGPLGDEAREIKPAELAGLPSKKASEAEPGQ